MVAEEEKITVELNKSQSVILSEMTKAMGK